MLKELTLRTPRSRLPRRTSWARRLPGKHRHLPLNQGLTAIGAARVAGILEYSLLDNFCATGKYACTAAEIAVAEGEQSAHRPKAGARRGGL
jgi:hypothetical protein